jgi:hypothetical protein
LLGRASGSETFHEGKPIYGVAGGRGNGDGGGRECGTASVTIGRGINRHTGVAALGGTKSQTQFNNRQYESVWTTDKGTGVLAYLAGISSGQG